MTCTSFERENGVVSLVRAEFAEIEPGKKPPKVPCAGLPSHNFTLKIFKGNSYCSILFYPAWVLPTVGIILP